MKTHTHTLRFIQASGEQQQRHLWRLLRWNNARDEMLNGVGCSMKEV